MTILTDIWHGVREGFFMFWETLWALVLGFGLSGAVQAFVSRREMERVMGDHSPTAVARATGLGMVSSSCSYAATAMAKSLFEKGADFISSMVFMFASTNLVLELGIVLVVLMGWQFAAAEFIGGPIMILLLVVIGSFVLTKTITDRARRHVQQRQAEDEHHHHSDEQLQREPWSVRLRSKAGWSDAAAYTMADLKMLRRELVIGYTVAGFLAVLVSNRVWNEVFLHGHGWLTSVENVVVGPVIAFISFVCSIGNVPMAAALWHGGISFGGVISFIFADLIALPLVLIYRKYYGGLVVEGLFYALGWIPDTRPAQIVKTGFALNYTSVLNVLFLSLFGVLYWLYRNRERLGGGAGYAIDPVCGMQVETAHAPARAVLEGNTYYFCSEGCRDHFLSQQTSSARSHT